MKKSIVLLLFIFNTRLAYARITQDVINGCVADLDAPVIQDAFFQPNSHTCLPGYYLPANYDGCAACPTNTTCVGGTYSFNETRSQGLIYNGPLQQNLSHGCAGNPLTIMTANFTPNQHTCNPGYYMPANTDGCVICPADSYCPGGHYVFNETMAQGITACATGLYAPTGMWESAQCGRILHIGENVLYLRSTKKTTHALHFAVGGNGGLFFANATTADVPMHAETNRRLKIKYNDVVYSIYDDTVSVNE